MKCHYEVLGLDQNAKDKELRASYKQMALKWHPDKNITNLEEATEQFKLIQFAYQVLSDPHERAYYDKNREFILREGQPADEKELVDILPFFKTNCFKGFNDDDEGFFTVYRKVFEELVSEEGEVFPGFGDSASDYDDVVGPFYRTWEQFCSCLEFEWLYEHDPSAYRDRRIARHIKKENQRVRDAARKERNSNVRSLVLFIKKRDPRVMAHLAKLRDKQEADRQYRESKREQQKQEKLKKIEEFQPPEWISLDELEKQLRELEVQHDDAQLNEEDENCLFCIVCDKLFMSAKSYGNHVKSKKHKFNEKILKLQMEEEEEEFNDKNRDEDLEEAEIETDFETLSDEDETLEPVQPEPIIFVDPKPKKNRRRTEEIPDFTLKIEDDNEVDQTGKVLEKNRRKKNQSVEKEETAESVASLHEIENRTDSPPAPSAATSAKSKGHKGKRAKKKIRSADEVTVERNSHTCVSCGTHFSSRNKMFDHLKQTGHARPCSK